MSTTKPLREIIPEMNMTYDEVGQVGAVTYDEKKKKKNNMTNLKGKSKQNG